MAFRVNVQVVLTAFKAANAEQVSREPEHVDPALVVSVFPAEQALHNFRAVQGLGVRNHAAQQRNQFVRVPRGVLSDEQVGAVVAIVSAVGLVDVFAQHVHGLHAVQFARFVHLRDDVAVGVVVLGHDFNRVARQVGGLDLNLASRGHVGGVNRSSQLLGSFRGELAFAVQQLLHPVNAHQGHPLDVVNAVEVGAEVDGAGVSAAGDGQQNDGVRFQIGLEVRHLIQIVRKVHDQAVFARFAQLRRRTAQHVNVVHLLFPVIEFGRSAVALINAVELDSQRILDRNPGGLQVARVVGHAVGQRDAFARDFRVKGQAGFGIVVAGAHAKFGAFRIGQRVFRAGQAEHGKNHDQCQYHREKLFHLGIPSFYF